jgi:hypothetical protein
VLSLCNFQKEKSIKKEIVQSLTATGREKHKKNFMQLLIATCREKDQRE